MKVQEFITEITRLSVSNRDFEHDLDRVPNTVKWQNLPGDYLGDDEHGDYCFGFDVVPGTGELAPAVKTAMNKIYTNSYNSYNGNDLFARWVG